MAEPKADEQFSDAWMADAERADPASVDDLTAAFDAGEAAAAAGKTADDNPHPRGSRLFNPWRGGCLCWLDAARGKAP